MDKKRVKYANTEVHSMKYNSMALVENLQMLFFIIL